jgi:hypothetical protein
LTRNELLYLIGGGILMRLFNLPFQLAGGLMLPSVQRWFEARLKKRAFAKSKRMRTQYEEALYFVTYPHRMTHYFLNRTVEIIRLALFLGIFMLGIALMRPTTTGWVSVTQAIGFVCATFFLIWEISRSVNRLHDIYYRVEFWGEYRQKVLATIPDIEREVQSSTIASSSE